jgi:hypothetical protein
MSNCRDEWDGSRKHAVAESAVSESGAAFKLRRLVEAGAKLERVVRPACSCLKPDVSGPTDGWMFCAFCKYTWRADPTPGPTEER